MNLTELKKIVDDALIECETIGLDPNELPVYIITNSDTDMLSMVPPDDEISGMTTFSEPCDKDGNKIESDGHPRDIHAFVLANYEYEVQD